MPVRCPSCHSDQTKPAPASGLWERLGGLLGRKPYFCDDCFRRFVHSGPTDPPEAPELDPSERLPMDIAHEAADAPDALGDFETPPPRRERQARRPVEPPEAPEPPAPEPPAHPASQARMTDHPMEGILERLREKQSHDTLEQPTGLLERLRHKQPEDQEIKPERSPLSRRRRQRQEEIEAQEHSGPVAIKGSFSLIKVAGVLGVAVVTVLLVLWYRAAVEKPASPAAGLGATRAKIGEPAPAQPPVPGPVPSPSLQAPPASQPGQGGQPLADGGTPPLAENPPAGPPQALTPPPPAVQEPQAQLEPPRVSVPQVRSLPESLPPAPPAAQMEEPLIRKAPPGRRHVAPAPRKPAPRHLAAPAAPAAPRRPQAAQAEAKGGYALQFGAFTQEALAKNLVRKLQANGVKAQMRPEKDRNGKVWHKVRAGGYATAQEAQQAASRLERLSGAKPLVVRQR